MGGEAKFTLESTAFTASLIIHNSRRPAVNPCEYSCEYLGDYIDLLIWHRLNRLNRIVNGSTVAPRATPMKRLSVKFTDK